MRRLSTTKIELKYPVGRVNDDVTQQSILALGGLTHHHLNIYVYAKIHNEQKKKSQKENSSAFPSISDLITKFSVIFPLLHS